MKAKDMKNLFLLIIFLFILSIWFHQPWDYVWAWINDGNITIPDRLELLLSVIVAFLLVLFVEWLRGSSIEFYIPDPVSAPLSNSQDRKLIKVGIKAKNRPLTNFLSLSKILPSHAHAFASLTVSITHPPKPSYRAKWDIAPEPIEYEHTEREQITLRGGYHENKKPLKNFELQGDLTRATSGHPKYEMIPLALHPENLFPGDRAEASIGAKHQGERYFWIFDPEYYFSKPENRCFLTRAYLRVVFKSSLGKWKEFFLISNPSSDLERFEIEKITEDEYSTKVGGD